MLFIPTITKIPCSRARPSALVTDLRDVLKQKLHIQNELVGDIMALCQPPAV